MTGVGPENRHRKQVFRRYHTINLFPIVDGLKIPFSNRISSATLFVSWIN